MNWELRSCLASTAVVASALGAQQPSPKIAVYIYNYAAVSPKVLAIAEREAVGVYARSGIEIGCPHDSRPRARTCETRCRA
jgi:hypothetical protein